MPEAEFEDLQRDLLSACPPERAEWLKTRLAYANELSLRQRLKELIAPLVQYFGDSSSVAALIDKVVMTRNYLTHYDKSSAQAADGLAAVAVAAEFRPHATLLDLGLPRLNGYDAARRIREQSWGRNMLLIAMTGWGQEADRQRSREAGFDHHLVKPVDLDALERLLAVP